MQNKAKSATFLDELRSALPSITVSLPTQGLLYPPGVLADGADPINLEIKPSTVLDEIAFRNPYKAISGTALAEMIGHVCPSVLQPNELCMVDVEIILLAARLASHGATMDLGMTCSNPETVEADGVPAPKCRARTEVKLDIKRAMAKYVPVGEVSKWQVVMTNGHKVQVRPMSYAGMRKATEFLIEQTKNQRDLREIERAATESAEPAASAVAVREGAHGKIIDSALALEVESLVDGIAWISNKEDQVIDDRFTIRQWLSMAPVEWMMRVRDKIAEANAAVGQFGVNQFKCPECGHDQQVSVASDPSLFFSSGSPGRLAWTKSTS